MSAGLSYCAKPLLKLLNPPKNSPKPTLIIIHFSFQIKIHFVHIYFNTLTGLYLTVLKLQTTTDTYHNRIHESKIEQLH